MLTIATKFKLIFLLTSALMMSTIAGGLAGPVATMLDNDRTGSAFEVPPLNHHTPAF